MAKNSTVSVVFKVEDAGNGFQKLSLDAQAFKKVIGQTVVEAEKLRSSIFNFAAIATGLDSVSKTLTNLQNVVKDLTAAHAAQIQVETQLAVNMRNTMAATEQQIQSIKDLCSAQQELGIVGDEVQLAGAQKLALSLREKQSLDSLIPAMNDLAAAQFGYNVTQENAAQIATAMGKAITGQITALKRYGLMFTDAQEQIMKYGTEAQRVAVLCEVVSGSVGGMNAELAKIPDGKVKQLENYFGDLKETLGGIAQFMMPYLEWATNATIAALGITKLCAAIGTLIKVSKGLHLAQKAVAVETFLATGSINIAKQAANDYSSAAKGSAASATALKFAFRGLLIASGVGIAIAALTTIIYKLVSASDDATESTDKLLTTQERAKRDAEQLERLREQENSTLVNTRAALEINISRLREFNGTKAEEKKLVGEMNDTYGASMGYFSSVSDWYNALISNSEAYCQQMVIEARTRMLANLIAEKEQENHNLLYDEKGNKRKYSTTRQHEQIIKEYRWVNGIAAHTYEDREIVGSSDLDKAQETINSNAKEIANLRKQLKSAAEEAADIQFSVKGSNTSPDAPNADPNKLTDPGDINTFTSIEQFTQKRKYLQQLCEKADFDQQARIKQQIALLDQLQERLEFQSKLKADGVVVERFHSDVPTIPTAPLAKAPEAVDRKLGGVDQYATSLRGITENIQALNAELYDAKGTQEAGLINEQIALWEKKAEAIRNAGKAAQDTTSVITDAVRSMGASISSLGSSLELPALNVAGTMAQAIATLSLSFAQAMSKPKDPISWLVFGAAGLAELVAMVSTMKNLPAFASGGIISGPTIGLMGEYAGASNNPEVVAPLDKLRSLIQPAGGVMAGKVVFEIKGRTLRGVLKNEENFINRT